MHDEVRPKLQWALVDGRRERVVDSHERVRRSPDDTRDVDPEALANATLAGSFAMLADFAGNLPALDLWAPRVMRQRLDRRERDRVPYETPFGMARGTSVADADGEIVWS